MITEGVKNPSNSPVSAAHNHPDIGDLLEHLETRGRPARLEQVVHLPGVQQVLALPQNPRALPAARFGVHKDQQGLAMVWRCDLKRAGPLRAEPSFQFWRQLDQL